MATVERLSAGHQRADAGAPVRGSLALAVTFVFALLTTATATPLEFPEVADGLRAHPLATAATATLERAEGERLASEGAFDLRVRARAERVLGYYDRTILDGELRQPTRLRGLGIYAGWRLGSGDFADYDLKAATLDRGEVRAGVELPLLAGGAIDRARADQRKATYGLTLGRAEVTRRMLELERDAAVTYWDWVAAGQRLELRERQLELARRRGRDLQTTIQQGSTAPIEGVDNARLIAARESSEVAARRDFVRMSLELSIYLRDRQGAPSAPARDRVPAVVPLPQPVVGEADLVDVIREARTRQPSFAMLDARLAANRVDLDLADNGLLPSLTASVYVMRGIGPGDARIPDRDRGAVGGTLTFEIPLERSQARGALAMARADRKRLLAEQQLLIERLAIDARFGVTELTTARQRVGLAAEQARIADQLADAERLRFERGDSTILIVNLREEAAADAAVAQIDAMADYRKARARYLATLGRSPVER